MKGFIRFCSVFLIFGLVSIASAETQSNLWQAVVTIDSGLKARSLDEAKQFPLHAFEGAKLMTLNEDLMREYLGADQRNNNLNFAAKNSYSTKKYSITIPLPDGSIIELTLVKDSVLHETLAAKYPDINTYRVLANDLVFSGKIDISDSGFHAMLHMLDGETVFIDPVELGKSQYVIFNKSAQKIEGNRQHSCGVDTAMRFDKQNALVPFDIAAREISASNTVAARTQQSLKNYTIAVATTGEYSAKFGGSVSATMAAITTTINRVNQVLERDLGIHLNLVENNDLLINTDALSDPFDKSTLLDLVFQNQEYIDTIIGNGNYDIGHLFTTSGGGLAAVASVCNTYNKAKGASGISSPKGDSFDLDFVAHEIGHQLGATHTFNSSQGACSSETRSPKTAFEPGSGSSIMSYAGYCGLDNIQSNTDSMYHIGSIKQIAEYTNIGTGSTCGVVTQSENTPPQVDAGKNYKIPARTPFELVGDAVDNDGDSLLYAWEQLDAGTTSTESSDKGNNALFRVHAPNTSKLRSFPPLKNILNHTAAKGETLPKHQRFLTMSFVAQDGFNPAQSDVMRIQVLRTGSRFALNYPRTSYTRGSTYPIYWNTANTDQEPINCSSVNVWLSSDSGQNFNQSIAENIPNTGEAMVTIPADIAVTARGRFKMKCVDNIFFAVSYRDFFVTANDGEISSQYNDEDQQEKNLADTSLSEENSDASSNTENSGGGLFELFVYLLLPFTMKSFRLSKRNICHSII